MINTSVFLVFMFHFQSAPSSVRKMDVDYPFIHDVTITTNQNWFPLLNCPNLSIPAGVPACAVWGPGLRSAWAARHRGRWSRGWRPCRGHCGCVGREAPCARYQQAGWQQGRAQARRHPRGHWAGRHTRATTGGPLEELVGMEWATGGKIFLWIDPLDFVVY